mmetsp:Transcript_82572/g.184149  ORF Transcript_82572/g.184149 Transcript_82572/m.184149 type:complete len:242 (+) Transcript_82572:653-1378(+)
MLRVLHQELPDSESIELAVFVVVGLHHLEELYYLLKVHGEEGVLQNLEDRDRDPKYHRKALAHDGVPDDQDHREREAIDEERQEPLVEVHGGLHVFLDEVIPQLRHGLLHEAVTDAQVAAQQRKPLFVEPCEPELGMVHEAHEHGEALLLAPRNEEQEAGDEVHALAIAEPWIPKRQGAEKSSDALGLLRWKYRLACEESARHISADGSLNRCRQAGPCGRSRCGAGELVVAPVRLIGEGA